MNNKEKSLGMALIMLIFLIVIISLSGCRGPVKHLQLSDWHKQQAIKKGAKVKMDTITFHFKSPEIKFSTTIRPTWMANGSFARSLAVDTLIANDPKTGSNVKLKINQNTNCPDSCNQITTVYVESETPPQNQSVDVPCETVQAGYTVWDAVIFGLFMIPGGWLIMTFLIVPLVRFIQLRR